MSKLIMLGGKLMKIKFFRGLLHILCITILFSIIESVCVFAGTREWKFDDKSFSILQSTGVLSEKAEINGLTIYPGVNMSNSLKIIKGARFNNYLSLDKSEDKSQESVSFYLNGASDIYIIGKSDNENELRNIRFYFETPGITKYIALGKANGYKFEYRGSATKVYINSVDDDVRIYTIAAVDYVESEHTELAANETYYWDFSGISGGTNYTSNTSINGLDVFATEEKPISVYSGVTTDSGYRFYYGLDLKGSGSQDYRTLAFNVPRNSEIYITARISNYGNENNTRNLYVTNKYCCDIKDYYNVLSDSKLTIGGTTKTYKVKYTGDGEKLFIRAESGGIRIQKIQVVGNSNFSTVADDHTWIFDNYNNTISNGNIYNTTIDGLTIKSNISRPATYVESTSSEYSKAIRLTSSFYDDASKICFNICDSSNDSDGWSLNGNRKIRVVAKGASSSTKLILGNKYGYCVGWYYLSEEPKEYVFDYKGGYDELILFTNEVNSGHRLSEIYSISTTDYTYGEPVKLNVYHVKDSIYKYNFTVDNIPNTKNYIYTIKYDGNKNILMNVGKDYNNSNTITDNNIEVISNLPGEIKFRLKNTDEAKWSGIITFATF